MDLNIKSLVRDNIVPVICGATSASAFFISDVCLLTARHNVIDFIVDGEPVYIFVNGSPQTCSEVIPLGSPAEKIDVAILKVSLTESACRESGLSLLSAKFKEVLNLHTIGYPREIGNNCFPIYMPLQFVYEVPDSVADVVLAQTSPISFFSFAGYSGAPVMNNRGSVVAVLIIQENKNLRAVSISKLTAHLKKQNILVSTAAHFEDDSPTGLLRCVDLLRQAFEKAGNKYIPDLHLPHKGLESQFAGFINPYAEDNYNTLLRECEDWCTANPSLAGIKLGDEDSDSFDKYLRSLNFVTESTRCKLRLKDQKLLKAGQELYLKYEKALHELSLDRKRIFGIFGPAGVGKSHWSCHFANEYLKNGHNVYFFFGNNFDSNDDISTQILQKLGLDNNQLRILETECLSRKRETLFVIDAINEGPPTLCQDSQINKLLNFLSQYKGFKVLITGRRTNSQIYSVLEWNRNIDSSKTITFDLQGFEDTHLAIISFCNRHHINSEWAESLNVDFSNPLLLSLFCQSRQRGLRGINTSRIDIYSDYLTRRNISISKMVDADTERNVTLSAVQNIAKHSAVYNHCSAISRSKAYSICNRILHRPHWSSNLLHSLITENIFYEVSEGERYENQKVEFEFQNIGDVFKANALILSKKPISSIVNDLLNNISNEYDAFSEDSKNTLTALIALCERPDFCIDTLKRIPIEIITDSLWYGGPNLSILEECIKNSFGEIGLIAFFRNLNVLSLSIYHSFHSYLASIPANERDLRFIKQVNRLYDYNKRAIESQLSNLSETNSDLRFKKLIYLGWLCMTSYPDFQAILIRHISASLYRDISLAKPILELFANVDDFYVSSSVVCGVYGALLLRRDKKATRDCAKSIYELLYCTQDHFPRNLLLRQWSWQILELAYISDKSFDYILKISLPLQSASDPLSWNLSDINENVFGNTPGGRRLMYNLFPDPIISSDFNRYIIGTNHRLTNRYFRNTDGDEISLKNIEKMIAWEILRLGWNDNLGRIDDGRGPSGRTDNRIERIGKKYLWIAYQNVMALLSDNCLFDLESLTWNGDHQYIPNSKPWMIEGHSHFDPTLNVKALENISIPRLSFKTAITDFEGMITLENNFPSPIFIANDSEYKWIQIDAWDNWRNPNNHEDYSTNFHLQCVSWFIKDATEVEITTFLSEKPLVDFNMPYDSQYEYLWNEYPWSERTKFAEYKWEDSAIANGKIMPARVCQLQESMMGIEYEDFPIQNSMAPNWEFMNFMNLHTAERGIIRDSDDTVIAYNRNLVETGCAGLIVRKDVLDNYLATTGCLLITRVEYYKSTKVDSSRMYEWFIYNPVSGFKSIITASEKY